MDGHRHQASAQRMPNGEKQAWGEQPLFDPSDSYVIPEAFIYEIFGGIHSSTPSSSEQVDCLVGFQKFWPPGKLFEIILELDDRDIYQYALGKTEIPDKLQNRVMTLLKDSTLG